MKTSEVGCKNIQHWPCSHILYIIQIHTFNEISMDETNYSAFNLHEQQSLIPPLIFFLPILVLSLKSGKTYILVVMTQLFTWNYILRMSRLVGRGYRVSPGRLVARVGESCPKQSWISELWWCSSLVQWICAIQFFPKNNQHFFEDGHHGHPQKCVSKNLQQKSPSTNLSRSDASYWSALMRCPCFFSRCSGVERCHTFLFLPKKNLIGGFNPFEKY